VINLKRLGQALHLFSTEQMVDFILHFGYHMEEKLVIAGKAEGFDIIFDVEGSSISDVSVDFM
jgi:hypothetical protein